MNPDMIFINTIIELYQKTGHYWNNDNGEDLEALGGGFNVRLEALQSKSKRKKMADKLRLFADCMDEVIDLVSRNSNTKK